jgi:cardiolipin synthase
MSKLVVLNKWRKSKVYLNEEIIKKIKRAIILAKKEILIEMYSFYDKNIGIIKLLNDAVSRGVSVRVIIDGFGSFRSDLSGSKFEYRIYNNLFLLKDFNKRDHRKLIIIDKNVIIGSSNLGEEFLSWKELTLELQGDSWSEARRLFYNTWEKRNRCHKNYKKNVINGAKKRIIIITPYFIPPSSSLLSLIKAAKRGVNVDIIMSSKSDVFFTKIYAKFFYKF